MDIHGLLLLGQAFTLKERHLMGIHGLLLQGQAFTLRETFDGYTWFIITGSGLYIERETLMGIHGLLCPATRKWRGIMLYPPKF